jgi:DNA-binding MarR family transcriptional regulator
MMMKTESDPQLNTKLLQVICQLHEWENQHLDLVQTQAGRYLYLSLVKQLIEEKRDQPSALLKGIYHNQDLSERALRYKIREFEEDGLIKFEASRVDKRSKKIVPTEDLLQTLETHSTEFGRILGTKFLVFPKK